MERKVDTSKLKIGDNSHLALAGGGGSSSSSSSFSSSSSSYSSHLSSSSDIRGIYDTPHFDVSVLVALGAIAVSQVVYYKIARQVSNNASILRKLRQKNNVITAIVVGACLAVLVLVGLLMLAGIGKSSDLVIAIFAGLIAGILVSCIINYIRFDTLINDINANCVKSADVQVRTAALSDKAWDKDTLESNAENIYLRYQQDWSNFNTDDMKNYMTPHYYEHACLMMEAIKDAGRRNVTTVNNVISARVMARSFAMTVI